MKITTVLMVFTLVFVAVFVFGCTQKTILKEDSTPQGNAEVTGTVPTAKAPEKNNIKDYGNAKKHGEPELVVKKEGDKQNADKRAATGEKASSTVVPANELYEFVDIHFDFDKFNLRSEDRTILNKDAEWLRTDKVVNIVIEGHCDERGTSEYNLALGERRANSAAKYLIDMGIDGKRIKTISYGFERPLDPGHNEEAWSINRRAHFVVSEVK